MASTILLLEHDEDDLYITQEVFAELNLPVKLITVKTSEDLFNSLYLCIDQNGSLPSMILMNYNAVPTGTLEIVASLKANPLFSAIPVVVGCGVANDNIVSACYSKGVSAFIKKANSTADMKRNVSHFMNYWFDCVLLPKQLSIHK